MKEEKVIVDKSFVLEFEDSTQPAKRIKQEPTDPDIKESKVFVDAITQTEAFDADLKVEIATQTDRPLIFVCKLYMCGHNRFCSSEKLRSHLLSRHGVTQKCLEMDYFKKMLNGHTQYTYENNSE